MAVRQDRFRSLPIHEGRPANGNHNQRSADALPQPGSSRHNSWKSKAGACDGQRVADQPDAKAASDRLSTTTSEVVARLNQELGRGRGAFDASR